MARGSENKPDPRACWLLLFLKATIVIGIAALSEQPAQSQVPGGVSPASSGGCPCLVGVGAGRGVQGPLPHLLQLWS